MEHRGNLLVWDFAITLWKHYFLNFIYIVWWNEYEKCFTWHTIHYTMSAADSSKWYSHLGKYNLWAFYAAMDKGHRRKLQSPILTDGNTALSSVNCEIGPLWIGLVFAANPTDWLIEWFKIWGIWNLSQHLELCNVSKTFLNNFCSTTEYIILLKVANAIREYWLSRRRLLGLQKCFSR